MFSRRAYRVVSGDAEPIGAGADAPAPITTGYLAHAEMPRSTASSDSASIVLFMSVLLPVGPRGARRVPDRKYAENRAIGGRQPAAVTFRRAGMAWAVRWETPASRATLRAPNENSRP